MVPRCMYVCMYVCLYVCQRVRKTCEFVHLCLGRMCMHTCMCIYLHVSMSACVYAYVYMLACNLMNNRSLYMYVCASLSVLMNMLTCAWYV